MKRTMLVVVMSILMAATGRADFAGTGFSGPPFQHGTLTDTKVCIYTAGTGIVCNSDAGAGDMTKAVYDAGDDGQVDNAALADAIVGQGDLALLDNGTLTNTYVCTWVAATGLVCNTDPATLGGDDLGSAASSDIIALFNSGTCSGYLKSDGQCDSPAGAGTVNGPSAVTEDNVVVWGVDNAAIKDSGVALSALATLASPTFTGVPAAPTASADTDTTQLATTAFVIAQGYAKLVSPSFTTPTLGVASATTLNTGQGAYELYAMDQNVRTTDNVVFNTVTATEGFITSQSAAVAGYIQLSELSGNGTNTITIEAPDAITDTLVLTYPNANPSAQVLQCAAPADNVSACTWVTAVKEGTATGGLLFGDASPDAAGEIGYSTGLLIYGENSEDLKIAVGSAANTVTVSSNTGVTDISLSAINLATTGTMTGGIMILDNVASPTAAQVYGSWNETTGAGTITLPAVAAGMSTCIGTSAAAEMIIELDGSDHFVLAGLTMADGEAIINSTAEAAGDYICVIGLNATTWKVVGKQGTFTEASP